MQPVHGGDLPNRSGWESFRAMPDPAPPAAPHPARAGAAVVTAVAVCVLAWASAFVVIRGVGPHFSGGALALARLLIGAVLLSLPLLRLPWLRPTAREWALVAAYGCSWFGLYNVALNIAEHTLDAGTAATIVNLGPLLIALGAGAFLGERLSAWLAIGSGVAFGEAPAALAIAGGVVCLAGVALSRRRAA